MQLIHAFNISPEEYYSRGKKNDFPRLDVCPCCLHPSNLPRHGFYWRNALFRNFHIRIPILRLKCSSCGKTISFLPDFLLPYFQYSLEYVLEAAKQYIEERKATTYYQLLQFYRRRFLRNLNRILAFFRDQGYKEIIEEKDKAIKLLKLIGASPEAKTFAKRFQDHFQHNFMAN
jgi:hypothetical protein